MKEDKDRLKGLFQEMKLDSPSVDFEYRLMQSIHAISKKNTEKEKLSIKSIMGMVGAIIAILGIPYLVLSIVGIFTKYEMPSMSLNIEALSFNSGIISIAGVCLFLLIAEMLVRKYVGDKNHK